MTDHDNKGDVHPEITPEFSRPVDVTTLGAKGRHYKFQTTLEENNALAQRYSILSVDSLEAKCVLVPTRKGRFKLNVTFNAGIVQACGVSLESVEEKISGEFTIIIQQARQQRHKEPAEIDFDLDDDDTEFLESTLVDIGEMIVQHLSLEINPYPRKPDATGEELGQKIVKEEDLVLEPEKKNPFEVLKSLKH